MNVPLLTSVSMDAARISRDFLDVNVALVMNWTEVEATAQISMNVLTRPSVLMECALISLEATIVTAHQTLNSIPLGWAVLTLALVVAFGMFVCGEMHQKVWTAPMRLELVSPRRPVAAPWARAGEIHVNYAHL